MSQEANVVSVDVIGAVGPLSRVADVKAVLRAGGKTVVIGSSSEAVQLFLRFYRLGARPLLVLVSANSPPSDLLAKLPIACRRRRPKTRGPFDDRCDEKKRKNKSRKEKKREKG